MILLNESAALPLEKFHRHAGVLTLELSDLGPFRDLIGGRCGLKFIHPIYDDACDAGIAIRSHHTGNVVRFYWEEDKGLNDDYSLGHDRWEFHIISEDAKRSAVKRVLIFND